MGHDFDGEELMTSETVEADGSVFGRAVVLEGRELLFFRPFVKSHADRSDRLFEEKGRTGVFVRELFGSKELFFQRIRGENPFRPLPKFHLCVYCSTSSTK
jgi:hypothetical protein